VHQVALAVLLDEGGRDLVRILAGLIVVVVMALLVALVTPVAILAGADFAATAPATAEHTAAPVNWRQAPTGRAVAEVSGGEPVEIARHYLGVPYVFGGANPAIGLDCSGLVQLVYRQAGVALPRTAQLQYSATTRVAREQLQPGDLVFFAHTYADPHDWITHVGIYVGDGMQINAPAEGHVVSIQPVFSGFWGAHFTAGGRVRRA
jgi:cell wall-associated NlpC family hydrolase